MILSSEWSVRVASASNRAARGARAVACRRVPPARRIIIVMPDGASLMSDFPIKLFTSYHLVFKL